MPVIAIDFDATIAYLKDLEGGRYAKLYAVLTGRGVSKDAAERAYRAAHANGFTFAGYVDAALAQGSSFDRTAALAECEDWLAEHLAVFPDVPEALASWQEKGYPIYILTTGNPDFQKQKIDLCHIPYTGVLFVATDEEKPVQVRELHARHGATVMVFDDKASVLDMVRERDPSAEFAKTFLVVREESKYRTQKARFPHQRVSDLRDISFESMHQ